MKQVDCDDSDASVYPGATELPNDGIDQDCDGSDSIVPLGFDGDGFDQDEDCDDSDASIYPGAPLRMMESIKIVTGLTLSFRLI